MAIAVAFGACVGPLSAAWARPATATRFSFAHGDSLVTTSEAVIAAEPLVSSDY
jgi:hypothetical protein